MAEATAAISNTTLRDALGAYRGEIEAIEGRLDDDGREVLRRLRICPRLVGRHLELGEHLDDDEVARRLAEFVEPVARVAPGWVGVKAGRAHVDFRRPGERGELATADVRALFEGGGCYVYSTRRGLDVGPTEPIVEPGRSTDVSLDLTHFEITWDATHPTTDAITALGLLDSACLRVGLDVPAVAPPRWTAALPAGEARAIVELVTGKWCDRERPAGMMLDELLEQDPLYRIARRRACAAGWRPGQNAPWPMAPSEGEDADGELGAVERVLDVLTRRRGLLAAICAGPVPLVGREGPTPRDLIDRAAWINANALVEVGRPLIGLEGGHLVLRDDVPAELIEARREAQAARRGPARRPAKPRSRSSGRSRSAGERAAPGRSRRSQAPVGADAAAAPGDARTLTGADQDSDRSATGCTPGPQPEVRQLAAGGAPGEPRRVAGVEPGPLTGSSAGPGGPLALPSSDDAPRPLWVEHRFDLPDHPVTRAMAPAHISRRAQRAQRVLDRHRPGLMLGCVLRDRRLVFEGRAQAVEHQRIEHWQLHDGTCSRLDPLDAVRGALAGSGLGAGAPIALGCEERPALPAPADATPWAHGDDRRAARAQAVLSRHRPGLRLHSYANPTSQSVAPRVRWTCRSQEREHHTVSTCSPIRAVRMALWSPVALPAEQLIALPAPPKLAAEPPSGLRPACPAPAQTQRPASPEPGLSHRRATGGATAEPASSQGRATGVATGNPPGEPPPTCPVEPAAEPPIPGAWRALVHRDGALGRWAPVDPSPTAIRRLRERMPGVVVIPVEGGADHDALAALAPAVAERVGDGVPGVVLHSSKAAIFDDCPTPLRRAVRWAIRARAQDVGEQLVGLDGPVDWPALSEAELLDAARSSAELAAELMEAVEATRRRIEKLPARGPDPEPALMGPCPAPGSMDIEAIRRSMPGAYAAVRAAIAAGGLGLVSTKGRRVRKRLTPQGRKRTLSLAEYLDVREQQADAGGALTDVALCRALADAGVFVSRTVVRQRRVEAEAAVRVVAPTATVEDPDADWLPEARPFMVWLGGKTRLLRQLIDAMPDEVIDLYIEPCIGGGALLLELAARGRFERAIACDIDEDIICLWRGVQRDPAGVFEMAEAWPWTPEGYLAAREAIPRLQGIERAGAILRVNRHAINGVWRRTKGTGLLSMGPGDKPGLGITVEDLQRASALVANVEFVCGDAARLLRSIRVEDGKLVVAYLDVPYWPVSQTANHCVYAGRGFQAGDHVRMVAALRDFAHRGGVGLLSNASNAPVQRLVAEAGARARLVSARRSVSVKASTRGGAPEVIAVFEPEGITGQAPGRAA